MDTDKIIQDLNRRFATHLPKFYQLRIIMACSVHRIFTNN